MTGVVAYAGHKKQNDRRTERKYIFLACVVLLKAPGVTPVCLSLLFLNDVAILQQLFVDWPVPFVAQNLSIHSLEIHTCCLLSMSVATSGLIPGNGVVILRVSESAR